MPRHEGAGQQPQAASTSPPPAAPKRRRTSPAGERGNGQRSGSTRAHAGPMPSLSDDEVDAIEREIIDDDFSDPRDPAEKARVENARRRLADHALVGQLIAADFTGPLFEITVTELAAYGIPVVMSQIRTGKIISQCKSKGRPLKPGSFELMEQWDHDDRLEATLETTARALKVFIDHVLKREQWDYQRGTTLKTFFVGTCFLQFPNVFDGCVSHQRRWSQVVLPGPEDDEPPEGSAGGSRPGSCWADPTAEEAIRRAAPSHALEFIEDPQTRQAAWLVYAESYSHADAGETSGLSAKAVEGRLRRLRERSQ
jgi:hypothetical protein